MPSVTYKPSSGTGYNFELKYTPTPSKSEWGMDMLTIQMWGAAPGKETYEQSLAQGQTYSFDGQTWYLQSWDDDHDTIFPTFTLLFKGLCFGIPDPKVSGRTIIQTTVLSCLTPTPASRSITYYTRQSTYKYITAGRPTGPSYTSPDISVSIGDGLEIIKSTINTADGAIYPGAAPAGLVTALTPVGVDVQAVMECDPVVGTNWFECEDTVTVLLPSTN